MVRAVRMLAMLAMLAMAGANTPPTTGCDDISALGNNYTELSRVGSTSAAPADSDTDECDTTAKRCVITCKPGFKLYNGDTAEDLRGSYNNQLYCEGWDANIAWKPSYTLVYCVKRCGDQWHDVSGSELPRLTGASATNAGTCAQCEDNTWAAADADNCAAHTECTAADYESVAPTATSDRVCAARSGCGYKLNGSTRLTNDGCSECDINTFAATYAENCTLMTATAATCAELRDEHNMTVDGLYTLSLKVNAVKIATYMPNQEQGCGIRASNDPAKWSTRLVSEYAASGGYNPAAANVKCVVPPAQLHDDHRKVIPTPKQVWCHMMGGGPKSVDMAARAYVNVDPARNTAQFQYGMTLYTTSFSKLRFDERTQLIYTADYTFATTSQEQLDDGLALNPCVSTCGPTFQTWMDPSPVLRSNCDDNGTFHVPFGTASACLSFGNPDCDLDDTGSSIEAANFTVTMQYDFSASELFVNQFKHTSGMGGGRVAGTDYAGGIFYKVDYNHVDDADEPSVCDGEGASGKHIMVSGACEWRSFLNGAYTLQGTTADGREYYANSNGDYIFYDANCRGDDATTFPMWKITNKKPNTTATTDLAGDGVTCGANAWLITANRTLPSSAVWQMWCAPEGGPSTAELSISPLTCTGGEVQVWMNAASNADEERGTFNQRVGSAGSRDLIVESSLGGGPQCMVAGPDVGHIKPHVANLKIDLGPERPSNGVGGNVGTLIGIGGWGFPMCLERKTMDDDIYVNTSNDSTVFEEYVPINCVTAENVQDTHAVVNFAASTFVLERDPNANYATGRTRPGLATDYGYVAHFYDDATRTVCDPATEDPTFEPGDDNTKDRVCAPKVITVGCTGIVTANNNSEINRTGLDAAGQPIQSGACDTSAAYCKITCADGFELDPGIVGGDQFHYAEGNRLSCVANGNGAAQWTPNNDDLYCQRICGTQTNNQTRLTGASATDPGTCNPCVSGTWAAADDANCVPHSEECPDGFANTAAPTATSDRGCIEFQCTAGSDEIYKRWGCNVSNPIATTYSELGTIGNLPGHICTIEPCASHNSDFKVYAGCAIDYHVKNGTCVACPSGTFNNVEHTLGGIDITDYADTTCSPTNCRDNKTIAEWNDLGCSGGSLGGNSMSDWDTIAEKEVYMLGDVGPADGYKTCTITCPQNDGEFAVTATCAADYHVQAGKCVACTSGATRDEGDGTANGDTHCSCGAGKWAAADAAVCTLCNTIPCTNEEYMETACTATTDRVCAAFTECPAGQSESAAPTATTDRVCAETVCTPLTDAAYRSFGCIVQNPAATTYSGLGTVSSATGYNCTVACPPNSGSTLTFALQFECVEDYHVQGGTCAPCSSGTHNAAGDDFHDSVDTTCAENECIQKTNADWIGLGCKDVSNATSGGAAATVDNLGDYKPAEGYATCNITCPENNGDFEVTATCAAQTHYAHSVATAAQVCTKVTECAAETHYESVAPTSTSDRGCTAVTAECPAGQYESTAPTSTSDRECEACTTFDDECTECSVSGCTLCSSGYYPEVSPGSPAGCTLNPRCHAEINQANCTAYTDSGLDHSRAPTDTGCAGATCTLEECCTPNVGCSMSVRCGDDNDSWSKYAIGNAKGGYAQCSGLDPTSCKPAECCINDASGGFAANVVSITGYSITVVVPSGELKPEPGGTVRYPNGLDIGIVGIVSATPTPLTSRARRADVEFTVGVDGAIPAGTQRVEVHPKAQPTRKSKKTKKAKKSNSTVNSWVIIGGVLVVAVIVVVAAVAAVCKRRNNDYARIV